MAEALCNIGYPYETHLNPQSQSHEIAFAHNWFPIYPTFVLKFCTEHGSITAVICAKSRNDGTTETDVMDDRDFARIEFKLLFGQMSYIAQGPWRQCHGALLRMHRRVLPPTGKIKSRGMIKSHVQGNSVLNVCVTKEIHLSFILYPFVRKHGFSNR